MSPNDLKPLERFSERVEDYAKYRPSYPDSLLDYLDSKVGALQGLHVADIGSGTGILTKLLLQRGARVDAVEPNAEMRAEAEKELRRFPQFRSHAGKAEDTLLTENSVNLITCAQAFHWFDPRAAREEFARILKSPGWVALIWNDQRRDCALGAAYEQIKLHFGGENFKQVKEVTDKLDLELKFFFGDGAFETHYFKNYQDLDEQGLIGRFLSSSYAPTYDSPLRSEAAKALSEIFMKFQKTGLVRLEYRTELFIGKGGRPPQPPSHF
jgi:SAM-dependent methyltransferase